MRVREGKIGTVRGSAWRSLEKQGRVSGGLGREDRQGRGSARTLGEAGVGLRVTGRGGSARAGLCEDSRRSGGGAPGGGAGLCSGSLAGRGGAPREGAGRGPAVRCGAGSGRQPGGGRKPEAAAAPARETWRVLKVQPWPPSSLPGPAVGCRFRPVLKPGAAPSARGRGTASPRPAALPASPGGGGSSPPAFAPRGAGGISPVFTLPLGSPAGARSSAFLGHPGYPRASPSGSSAPRSGPPPPPLPSFKQDFHFLTCPA